MITNIRLQNFRSYTDEGFDFGEGVNIIVGPNGAGKTNLLEALLLICSGSSYRVHDQDLIRIGAEWARLDTDAGKNHRTVKLQLNNEKIQKTYEFDENPYKILTFQHTLPVVLFEPNHLQLLHGKPDERRNYLDTLLEQTVPSYKTVRRHYRRILAQRNTLLKQINRPSKEQFFVWNLRLSELGGVIAKHRHELISSFSGDLSNLYNEIADSKLKSVRIAYESKLPVDQYETALMQALDKSYETDLIRGFTSFGPHRDDFMVYFDDRAAELVASRGETRTALLALKVHELTLIEKQRGIKPIMLLDDVFSELDGKRRHALTNHLNSHQTFITTTDADTVLRENLSTGHTIPLRRPE